MLKELEKITAYYQTKFTRKIYIANLVKISKAMLLKDQEEKKSID